MLRRTAVLGCLSILVPVIVVVAGLLVAGDVAARRYATGQLSDRVSAAVPEGSGVHSRIHSFPFIGRLLVNGDIPQVGTHIDRLTGVAGLTFSDLDVDLRDVALDRHAMLSHRQVRLTRIARGTVTVSLTEQALSAALGRPAHITGGAILVTVFGSSTIRAVVSVTPAHRLLVQVAGLSALSVALPTVKLLPCSPQLTVVVGRLDLGCTFTSIPAAFAQAVSGAH
jgi:hypothetical protein